MPQKYSFIPRKLFPQPPASVDDELKKYLAEIGEYIKTNDLHVEKYLNEQVLSASVSQTAPQPLADNILTIVTGPWTTIFDANNLVDTANNQILLPEMGLWMLSVQSTYNGLAGPNAVYYVSIQLVSPLVGVSPPVSFTDDILPAFGTAAINLTVPVLVTADRPRQSIQVKATKSTGGGAGTGTVFINAFSAYKIGGVPSIPGR